MDALELQKRLIGSGMDDDLSRDLLRFIEHRPELATKNDIELLRKDMDSLGKEIESLAKVSITEAQLEKAIGNLAWKVAGFLVAQAAVIVTLIKLL